MRRKFEKSLVGKDGRRKEGEVRFTQTAYADCADGDILLPVAADLVREAAEYVLKKKEGERFTIASQEINTVITGIVIYRDDEFIELLVTNVYNDVYFVEEKSADIHRLD